VSLPGRFITLEGIEGAGKSSLQRALAQALQESGRTVVCTREPGGTALAEEIRQLALARRADGMPATTELLLMFAARAAHVEQRIRPALERGEWVVCDRFTDASRAYQGGGRGLPIANIELLAQIAHPQLQPHLTLLLDVTPALGLARARQRNAQGDRFEDEALEFFARVRASYLQLAQKEPDRIKVLDASQSPAHLLQQALAFAEGL
jgi:dTMP kinase